VVVFSITAFFLGVAYFYFRPDLIFTPKTILVLDIGIFVVLFCFWRYLFSRGPMKNFKEKIVIIGMPDNLDSVMQNILASYKIVAFFLPNSPFSTKDSSHGKVVSSIDELEHIMKQEKVSLAVFTNEVYENKSLAEQLLSRLSTRAPCLHSSAFYELVTKRIPLEALSEIWFLEEVSRTESKIYIMLKRLFDLLLALVFFAITLVLFPCIAIAIRLDSTGPIFYSQQRVGRNRKVFTLYKFRTMQHGNGQEKTIWRENQKGQITRVGAFLRRFHLDELPQSMSILKGEIPFYHQRYNTQVGFTGWAAINYPPSNSIESAREKFEYDLYYIKNRSLFLDLEIILKTVRLILK
jgi:lipopolysaccharide/colanic/teichoic acid biosynthesis glycosyltransferase